jgi:colanic acid biosynthesis glycosyl transferase WcaI
MKILLYGINYYPELTGIGKYSGEMCAWFSDNNNEVSVVTAPPYYPDWKLNQGYKNRFYKEYINNITVYRCPLYIPKKIGTLKRVLHLVSFSLSSSISLFKLRKYKPDIMIFVVPTLFCAIPALLYSKYTKSKVVLHIQDFELDAMLGLSNRNNNLITSALFGFERKLFKAFDMVSTISINMLEKAALKGVDRDKLVLFPNWAETLRFLNVENTEQIYEQLGIDKNKKIVLYSGNIGQKQGLEILIPIAKRYEYSNENVLFLIVGNGVGKEQLISLAQESNCGNILFRELLPYEQLPMLLSIAHCHLVIQKKGVADAVLPSKLTNILAVGGQAVITAEENTELGKLCSSNENLAILVNPEDENELDIAIKKCLSLPKFNSVAQNYARDNLAKDKIMSDFYSKLISLCRN